MHKYTIPCTEEQAKKALELGAPLEVCNYNEVNTDICFFNKDTISCYKKPTAEEMIGWLEEQGILIDIQFCGIKLYVGIKTETGYIGQRLKIDSRKETVMFAIDTALEYLTNNKK